MADKKKLPSKDEKGQPKNTWHNPALTETEGHIIKMFYELLHVLHDEVAPDAQKRIEVMGQFIKDNYEL